MTFGDDRVEQIADQRIHRHVPPHRLSEQTHQQKMMISILAGGPSSLRRGLMFASL
jgi:hypothetical protein